MKEGEPFLSQDAQYVISYLLPEIAKKFGIWSQEYRKPRKRGVRGEFLEIDRKHGKLELALWDGVDTTNWREQPREILMEVAAHCFLAVKDLDDEARERGV